MGHSASATLAVGIDIGHGWDPEDEEGKHRWLAAFLTQEERESGWFETPEALSAIGLEVIHYGFLDGREAVFVGVEVVWASDYGSVSFELPDLDKTYVETLHAFSRILNLGDPEFELICPYVLASYG